MPSATTASLHPCVYFDANATTPYSAAAAAAVATAERDFWYNPSSPYPAAAAVHNRLENARAELAALLGCAAEQVVFNSGASEGAYSLFHYLSTVFGSEATVAISAIEHPCVRESARHFFSGRVIEIPVDANGVTRLDALRAAAEGRLQPGETFGDNAAAQSGVTRVQPPKAANATGHTGIADGTDVQAAAKNVAQPDALVNTGTDTPSGNNSAATESEATAGSVLRRPCLIALMAANNETGALQPWREALAIARANGIPFYTDASQWLGKEPASGLGGADFVTGCGHKFGGGKGVGFIRIGSDFTGFHAQRGGAQENGHRAGTENYPAVAGMLAALQHCEVNGKSQKNAWAKARNAFEARLLEAIPGLRINAQQTPRLANTSSLQLPKHRNSRWVSRLAKRGFCLSTGSACASGKAGPSYVLAAMGLAPEAAERTVRVSALHGEAGAEANWQALADAFIATWQELEAENSGGSLTNVISI